MTDAPDRAPRVDAGARTALAVIVAFALARLALAATLGLGVDEAYTIVVSRRLDLSYFDHPPLHQWIAHYAALAFGENAAMRLPFVALFMATGWLTFALTRRLFGARAGVVALFALNVSAFFLVS
ncbi:MAG TPA: glycosyltransferase family 39 protein, partial [Roseiarcus sp.]|nr:glycosyltransferase family 39 protein [Roseiarcus sp.]